MTSEASACWTCELSGEPLTTSTDTVVVTPSGHVCLKKLLLTKLAENGGTDPFVSGVPLNQDQLVTLQTSQSTNVIPPRPSVSSMPALLGLVGQEYNALTLELFDTRKALEETRKELSHALYQNDAAVRVVARLAQERDQARQELSQWNATSSSTVVQKETTEKEEPPTKRAKTTTEDTVDDGIPQEDLQQMTLTWQTLHEERKSKKKSMVVVPPETLSSLKEVDKKNWHKTRNKAGIVDMTTSGTNILTAGRDKQLVVYSLENKTLVQTINIGVVASSVDMDTSRIVAGLPKGKLVQYVNGEAVGDEALELDGNIVDVTLHPTGTHVVVTLENGSIVFLRIGNENMNALYTFKSDENVEYSSGCLHPDGLICAAGTSTGAVHLWDFKNQKLASTYESDETKDSPICALAFSNSGIHLAIATSTVIQVRDIRKSKVLYSLNPEKKIQCVAFDSSGKYLAYGGNKGVTVVTAKEGTNVTTLGKTTKVSNIVWTSEKQLITSGDADRQVRFYGVAEEDAEMKEE